MKYKYLIISRKGEILEDTIDIEASEIYNWTQKRNRLIAERLFLKNDEIEFSKLIGLQDK